MLRVFQVCTSFHVYGGVQTHVERLSRGLMDRGVQITLLDANRIGLYPKRGTYRNIEILRFRSWTPSSLSYFSPSMFGHLSKIRGPGTIVHAHNYQDLPSLMAVTAKRINNLPFVFTPHFHPSGSSMFRSFLKSLYHPVGKMLFTESDVVIALSKHERSQLERIFRLKPHKIRVIPSGSDRYSGGFRKLSYDILYVGRLEQYKGIHFLIDCLPEVLERLPNARLKIIGSGPYETSLRSTVAERGLSPFVNFFGNVSSAQLDELLRSAGLLALISQYEAYSLIIGEALQRGLQVLATRVGAIPEIYESEPGCTLIDFPPTTKQLATKIVEILSGQPASLKKDNLVTKRTWDSFVDEVLRLYREIL